MGILEGIGEHFKSGFSGVRDAERAKLAAPGLQNQSTELRQLLDTYRSIDPSQTEQRNQVLERITATPTFQKFQGTVGPLAESQMNRANATEKIGKLARAAGSAEDFISPELRTAIGSKITESFADIGIQPELSNEVSGEQRTRLSGLFSAGLKNLGKTSKGSRASTEETQAFANKFKNEAVKAGASPTAAAALFGELHDKEVDRRTLGTNILKDQILPKGSNAASFFPESKPAGKTKASDPLKAFEQFIQVGTPDFPEDNTPKPMSALGITEPADQQQFQELTQAAPQGMNVQSIAQQDPEAFKQVLAALRRGKTPSGKPFTIEDALKMMGQL